MLLVDKNYTVFCRAYRFSCMFRIRERDGRIKVELIIKMRLFDYRTTASLFLMLLFIVIVMILYTTETSKQFCNNIKTS